MLHCWSLVELPFIVVMNRLKILCISGDEFIHYHSVGEYSMSTKIINQWYGVSKLLDNNGWIKTSRSLPSRKSSQTSRYFFTTFHYSWSYPHTHTPAPPRKKNICFTSIFIDPTSFATSPPWKVGYFHNSKYSELSPT